MQRESGGRIKAFIVASFYLCFQMQIITKYFSDFSSVQLSQFEALESLYKEWNAKINVVSRKDIDGLYEKHVLHSLAIAAVYDFPKGLELIDIGTGGGFPGVPLAIFFPEVQFHLVDSIGKKLKVVEAIKAEINLPNLTTQHIRAEDLKGRKFDFALSRAVAPLKDLLRWSKPLLKSTYFTQKIGDLSHNIQSSLICLKGGDLTIEINESQSRPKIIELSHLFDEDFFKEKYLLETKPPKQR